MAVLERAEGAAGKGYGRTLLAAVQAVVKQRGGGLWCTARTNVATFYERYDFERVGDVFEVEGAGPHVLMTWNAARGRGVPADRREEHAGTATEDKFLAEEGAAPDDEGARSAD